jgi:predicted nucleotidyltransferase
MMSRPVTATSTEIVEQRLGVRREDILRVAARHGAINVRLFGSFARGDQQVDSDVDFLVDAGCEVTPFFPGGLIMDLEALLQRKVDVVETSALHRLIRSRVLQEAIPV